MSDNEKSLTFLKKALEAILFVSNEPLDISKILEITGAPQILVAQALAQLEEEFSPGKRGIIMVRTGNTYKMMTSREMSSILEQYFEVNKKIRLSRAMLEILSIVAYKAPITRAEIEDIRGVDASSQLARLQELELLQVVGQKEVPGRPNLYGTTDNFLEHFNLSSLAELPPMEEIRQLFSDDDSAQ